MPLKFVRAEFEVPATIYLNGENGTNSEEGFIALCVDNTGYEEYEELHVGVTVVGWRLKDAS